MSTASGRLKRTLRPATSGVKESASSSAARGGLLTGLCLKEAAASRRALSHAAPALSQRSGDQRAPERRGRVAERHRGAGGEPLLLQPGAVEEARLVLRAPVAEHGDD